MNPNESVAKDAVPETSTSHSVVSLASTVDGPALTHAEGDLPVRLGGYRIERILGEGGMGRVYLAWQENPRRQVALKVMLPGRASERGLRRFEVEAEILGRLQHPGIARIYEAGTAAGAAGPQPFFAMEYVAGKTLTRYCSEKGLDLRARVALLVQICDAVEHAHQKGIVHRDLKPANILVDDEGRPKVLDFGVARLTEGASTDTDALTDAGAIIGTLAYMSPEQARGLPGEIDTRSDVYALGAVLFQLASNKLPISIEGKSAYDALKAVVETEATPLEQAAAKPVGDLSTIAAKALSKEKEQRYAGAAALAEDLRRYLDDRPVLARPATTTYQLLKFVRRNRGLVAAAAGGALTLVAALAVVSVSLINERAARKSEAEQRGKAIHLDAVAQLAGARRLMQRGDWRGAAESLARCDPDALDDAVELDVERARVLTALNRRVEAKSLLDALAARSLGARTATVLLMRGDFQMAEFGGTNEAVALIKAAVEDGALADADLAYAKGLIDDRTTASAAAFRRALSIDAFHQGARSALVFVLTLLGELDEAERVSEIGQTLFPDDPNFPFTLAVVAALRGESAKARERLQKTRPQFGDAAVDRLLAVLNTMIEIEPALAGAFAGNAPNASVLRLLITIKKATEDQSGDVALVRIPALPCLQRAYGWVPGYLARQIKLFFPMNAAEEARLADELARAAEFHPEATLLALQATFRLAPEKAVPNGRNGFEADLRGSELMDQAARAPSFCPSALPVFRKAALNGYGTLLIIAREGKAPPKIDLTALKAKARDFTAFCLRTARFDPDEWNLIASTSAQADAHLLTRQAATQQLDHDPRNGLAKARLALAENKLGNHERAIALMDELIHDEKPTAFFMKRIREVRPEAAEALRASVKRLDSKTSK